MARSRALESALHRYDPESRVLDGRTAGIAQELEDRIAGVDRELELTELLEPRAREPELLQTVAGAGGPARRPGGCACHACQQRGALSPGEVLMWYAFVGLLVTGALVAPAGLLAQGEPRTAAGG